ncbi:acyclic terpene utilization AtuA family protein [Nocardioides gilvus]|uniref:acyclic terpene utilization AtuA family protein n=1 Tax=Nocardioides gilvus TaxID=1735589 RepID=UPI00194F6853|nr:acyclic terpene utilization AtuA family protein [Nocardioides gilvus]
MSARSVGSSPVIIGNCSGFYGDRLSAFREMLEGGQLDYLTGDYLAELTMLILGRDTFKDPNLGYARTFVRQCEDALGLALEKGVKIVSNAGGLNPAGLAEKLREVAKGLGLDVNIAHVEGDDLRSKSADLGFTNALTANAYLGGFGIAAALNAGADVVVTGRVTDASVIVGPAASHHGWGYDDLDAIAGAMVAGHVIECGTHATGGNFSGFLTLPASAREQKMGFPIAEIAADGSSVITKHAGTGGAVTVDTVTAQLVYEIQSGLYLGPDATADLASIEVTQEAPDRVAIAKVTGLAPPETLKVCVNELGGFRNVMEFLITGLDTDEKIAWIKRQVTEAWGDKAPACVAWSEGPPPVDDPTTMAEAATILRVMCLDTDAKVAGKGFTAPAVEIALASYPGCTLVGPPAPASPYGIYRPEYVSREVAAHTVVHADGRREEIADPTTYGSADVVDAGRSTATGVSTTEGETIPLGRLVHARSGDKGGNANLGLWIPRDGVADGQSGHAVSPADLEKYEARVAWLLDFVTPERVRELVPEAADLDVDVYALPHLGAVNVVIKRLLGAGVAASTRVDPQAKALGEWVRSRHVTVEGELL